MGRDSRVCEGAERVIEGKGWAHDQILSLIWRRSTQNFLSLSLFRE